MTSLIGFYGVNNYYLVIGFTVIGNLSSSYLIIVCSIYSVSISNYSFLVI